VRPTTAVADVLERARDVTQPLMRDAVARLAPSIRDVVSYHLGWTDAAGNPTAVKGGKGIRTALATLSAEASWADASVGAPGGVAVELVHNFSLLHDDLMDGDVERRHRPTAWSLWGPSVALLAGDALSTLATDVLLRSSNPAAPAATLALCEATAEMIAGQADDLAFEARRSVSVEECMGMSTAKTGALLGCAASIGAILAGAPPATVRALRDFGRHLGRPRHYGQTHRQRHPPAQEVDAHRGRPGRRGRRGQRAGRSAVRYQASVGTAQRGVDKRPDRRYAGVPQVGPPHLHHAGRTGLGAGPAEPVDARGGRPGHLAGGSVRGPRMDGSQGEGPSRRGPWLARASPSVCCTPSGAG
jgi:hypothetical protein